MDLRHADMLGPQAVLQLENSVYPRQVWPKSSESKKRSRRKRAFPAEKTRARGVTSVDAKISDTITMIQNGSNIQ